MPRLQSTGWPSRAILLLLISAIPSPSRAVAPSLTGQVPAPVSDAFHRGLFSLPRPPGLGTSSAAGVWKIPVILVDFHDQPLTYSSPADWKRSLFDTMGVTPTGSVYDYYRWVSDGRLRVIGQVVASVRLDQPKSYYAYNAWGLSNSLPQNSAGVVLEALAKSHTQVDWSEYDRDHDGYVDMLWVLHSGLGGENTVSRDNLWSITSRLTAWNGSGGAFVTDDLVPGTAMRIRVDAFTILPELSAVRPGMRAEIGVFCHEFGHALGLPDLYDTGSLGGARNVGPGNWSLMSTGTYGTDGQSPEFPAHVGAWPAIFLGWRQPIRPAHDTLLVLPPLSRGGSIVELWFQGEANHEHFLIENRQREGFDRNLVEEGLIVYHVDDVALRAGIPSNRVNIGLYPALRIIEADGRQDLMRGWNRGDVTDPMPGQAGFVRWDDTTLPNTRSLFGNVTHLGIEDIRTQADDVQFMARVRSQGWQSARDVSGGAFEPLLGTGPGARAAALGGGAIAAVTSELVQGRPQVVFRERHPSRTWEAPVTISASPSSATDPTIAAIPGGDACVVWSDLRHGPSELYFRSRIRGVWTHEVRLTDLPGTSRGASLGADARGSLHLAWLYHDSQGLRVHFMRFTYASPFGDPIPVSAPGRLPDLPAVVVAPEGWSYVLWPERASSPTTLWSARFSPESGLAQPTRLVSPQGGTLPAINGAILGGALHVAWPVSSTGGSELRYLRVGSGLDTALVVRGEPILDFMLAPGTDGGLHLVMEAARGGSSQILYKEWRSDGGWDIGDTEVTLPTEGVAARPAVLPLGNGVTVLHVGYPGGRAAFIERDRNLDRPLTAVAERIFEAPVRWRVWPNPVRAGAAIVLTGSGAPPHDEIQLFDLAGRVTATALVVAEGGRWRAEVTGTNTGGWPSGVYFARFRGEASRARIVVLR